MHVVVTGASSGIGEALAREFGKAGAQLTLVARREELLQKLAAELPHQTHVVKKDLLDLGSCTDWIEGAVAALGPVDVLVNNAGVQVVAPFEETDPAYGERCILLDLMAPTRITHAVLPSMLARRSGTIVDIASLAAFAPTPGMYYYNAAKGGYAAASEALRGELRGSGVHVVTVYPGPVKTAMADAAITKYGDVPGYTPTGTTDGLARLVRKAVRRKRSRVIYPRIYHLARWFPSTTRFVTDRLTPRLPRKGDAAQ
ncbi:MAG: SDR family NAD(P)-dependent oxidoreductase [Planctomycetota bacterium]|jgi:short-subunit dehydrogenase